MSPALVACLHHLCQYNELPLAPGQSKRFCYHFCYFHALVCHFYDCLLSFFVHHRLNLPQKIVNSKGCYKAIADFVIQALHIVYINSCPLKAKHASNLRMCFGSLCNTSMYVSMLGG